MFPETELKLQLEDEVEVVENPVPVNSIERIDIDNSSDGESDGAYSRSQLQSYHTHLSSKHKKGWCECCGEICGECAFFACITATTLAGVIASCQICCCFCLL